MTGRAPVICIRCGESAEDGHMHPPRTWSEFMKLAHERPLPLAAFDEAARLERRLERARRRAHRQADDRVR